MNDRTVGDGLTALARAMRAHLGANAKVFEVGGDGARRAARALAMEGVAIEPAHGEASVAAAVGARAGGAMVWLLASGSATELAARAMRDARRAEAGSLRVVIPSHGDDVGALVPLADGADLAALDGAPCARRVAESAHEIESLVRDAATPDERARDAKTSTAIVFDFRAIGLRIASLAHDPALDARDAPSSARAALVSSGSFESARAASRWLTDSSVSCVAIRAGAGAPSSEQMSLLERVEVAVVHELGAPFDPARWALARWAERAMPRAKLVLLASGPASASAFCQAVASESSMRRAALQAASRSLSVQLVGPPSTRFAAVEAALEALTDAGLAPSAECVEPTHARIDCDAGPAGATGTSGWVLIVPGLSVQAPIEPSLRGGAMIAEAALGSPLLARESAIVPGPEDQAALAVAAVHAELELRENQHSSEAIAKVAAALDRARGGGSPWAEVRARSLHLRSLR